MGKIASAAIATIWLGLLASLLVLPFALKGLLWVLTNLFWLMDALVGAPHPIN